MITFVGRRGIRLRWAIEDGLDERWFCHVATAVNQSPERGTGTEQNRVKVGTGWKDENEDDASEGRPRTDRRPSWR